MPFKIVFLENDGIVHVTYSGTVAKDDHHSALKEALELCANKKSTKLLVDFSKLNEGKLSTLDAFSFAEFVATKKTGPAYRPCIYQTTEIPRRYKIYIQR